MKDSFDFSNYPKNSSLYNNDNKKVPGKMKRELPDENIILFVGLRSKTYSIKTSSDLIEKRAKGITKTCQKDN